MVCRVDGRARLEIDDRGPGVPEPLSERFARGTRAGQRGADSGTGLGLALVARHVRRHRGAVWVDDRPGGGARFVVELPVADDVRLGAAVNRSGGSEEKPYAQGQSGATEA